MSKKVTMYVIISVEDWTGAEQVEQLFFDEGKAKAEVDRLNKEPRQDDFTYKMDDWETADGPD